MNKIVLALFLVLIILFSFVVVAFILIDLPTNHVEEGKLYVFPLLVGERTFKVTVFSNYSSAPEVSYFGLLKSVSFYFRGGQRSGFYNITIPNNLIWGELFVYNHGSLMDEYAYILSSNSTHNSVFFVFDLPAYTKDFDVVGKEGVSP
ncbi:MAG: hypothetical protein AC479_02795 [miscellaneous Crenarchaeota group-6 archaeon AD8-1]|nr:MAG: hypothetical protein AC479_02795 [miscellaneous Crenarchaeota group-6 archaeon AD8-1]